MRFTRRRWMQMGSGAAAVALGGGAAWWWAQHSDQGATDLRALKACLERLAQEGRSGWWDTLAGAHSGLQRGHLVREATHRARQAGGFTPERTRRCEVLVVGAGIAGLSAAWACRKAGLSEVAVLDLEDNVGGNSRGMVIGGAANAGAPGSGPLPCPYAAHYLPMPGPQALEVRELLQEWGLVRVSGQHLHTTALGERHLCHSPQERVFWEGLWFEGLIPPLAEPQAQALSEQAQRLSAWISGLASKMGFAMPSARAAWTNAHRELESITFARALDAQGISHPVLRAHLDYCCMDDFGAQASQVSAWAGVHYFASRHGFRWSAGEHAAPSEDRGVFTWPEGNGWLVQRFTESLKDGLHPRTAVLSVSREKHEVQVDALHWPLGEGSRPQRVRWVAPRVVLATPLFLSQRLLRGEPVLQAALAHMVPQMRWAPWLLTHLELNAPLQDRGGAAPSWDNVLARHEASGTKSFSLGYVDASKQSLNPMPGPTVLTHYQALGGASGAALSQARQALLNRPWTDFLRGVLQEMLPPHPDLLERLESATLVRHGHAMSVPLPGLRSQAAFAALGEPGSAVHLAHSDLAAYSVFEEACYWGMRAGAWASRRKR